MSEEIEVRGVAQPFVEVQGSALYYQDPFFLLALKVDNDKLLSLSIVQGI